MIRRSSPDAVRMSWAQVDGWRLSRQHLAERAPERRLVGTVRDTCGIHAQVMSAGEISLWTRVDGLRPQAVRRALWERRSLVKTWAMRGTLHLLPASDHPLWVGALRARRHWARPAWRKYFGIQEGEIETIIEAIRQALDGACLSREELAEAVGRTVRPELRELLTSGWGGLLKPAGYQGVLCSGPARGTKVTFVRPDQWLRDWTEPPAEEDALREVVRRYLHTYGPATHADFARWWGTEQGLARRVFRSLGGELAEVDVQGRAGQALAGDVEAILAQPPPSGVRLLPNFDVYVLGFQPRERLHPPEFKARIFRQAGWISPIVLVEGRAVGVWELNRARGAAHGPGRTVPAPEPAGAPGDRGGGSPHGRVPEHPGPGHLRTRRDSMSLLDEARELLDQTVALRRRIHRHPEVGLALPRTQEAVMEALDGLGYEVRTGRGTTSVVATLDGAHPGPTVLLRGDMDALPMPEDTGLEFASEVDGAMHACGHDAHTAMLAAAARLLPAHRDDLHGRVLLMFQPGEEGYFGARVMIEEGLLDGERPPSAAFAIHQTAHQRAGVISSKAGPLAASADTLDIEVRGRGGHASSPYLALDPVPAACEIALALQTMVTRRVNVFDPAVVTIAHITAGTTDNVIPETAHLEGTLRTLSEGTRDAVIGHARRLVESIGAAHGVEATLSVDEGYPPTVNDADMAAFALDAAREVLGEEWVEVQDHPVMGAEDFSYVLQRVPGAMVRLGMAPPGVEHPAPNHSNRMVIEESAMANGIAFHAGVALRYLDGSREGRPA